MTAAQVSRSWPTVASSASRTRGLVDDGRGHGEPALLTAGEVPRVGAARGAPRPRRSSRARAPRQGLRLDEPEGPRGGHAPRRGRCVATIVELAHCGTQASVRASVDGGPVARVRARRATARSGWTRTSPAWRSTQPGERQHQGRLAGARGTDQRVRLGAAQPATTARRRPRWCGSSRRGCAPSVRRAASTASRATTWAPRRPRSEGRLRGPGAAPGRARPAPRSPVLQVPPRGRRAPACGSPSATMRPWSSRTTSRSANSTHGPSRCSTTTVVSSARPRRPRRRPRGRRRRSPGRAWPSARRAAAGWARGRVRPRGRAAAARRRTARAVGVSSGIVRRTAASAASTRAGMAARGIPVFSRPKATSRPIVADTTPAPGSCRTSPTAPARAPGSTPSSRTVPVRSPESATSSTPARPRSSVDLPEPLGPTRSTPLAGGDDQVDAAQDGFAATVGAPAEVADLDPAGVAPGDGGTVAGGQHRTRPLRQRGSPGPPGRRGRHRGRRPARAPGSAASPRRRR